MFQKFVDDTGKDQCPPNLSAYREVPQASMGFSPLELLYHVRGPLDVLKETWEGESRSKTNIISYILKIWEKLAAESAIDQNNLRKAQDRQKPRYNWSARTRSFQPVDQVLLLLPSSDKLFMKWQGPYTVTRKIGQVMFKVHMPEYRKTHQVFHICCHRYHKGHLQKGEEMSRSEL